MLKINLSTHRSASLNSCSISTEVDDASAVHKDLSDVRTLQTDWWCPDAMPAHELRASLFAAASSFLQISYPAAASRGIVTRPVAVPVLFPVLSLQFFPLARQSSFSSLMSLCFPFPTSSFPRASWVFAHTVFSESCQCQSCPGHSMSQLPFANHPALSDQSIYMVLQKMLLLKVL